MTRIQQKLRNKLEGIPRAERINPTLTTITKHKAVISKDLAMIFNKPGRVSVLLRSTLTLAKTWLTGDIGILLGLKN